MPRIRTYPDPVLRAESQQIEKIDEGIQQLIDTMLDTMYKNRGIGLAAVQIGPPLRVIVFDKYPYDTSSKHPCVIINPEIISPKSNFTSTNTESCLSIPYYSAEIIRRDYVKVKGINQNEKPVDMEAEGLVAACIQHEIDHLNGILYIDYISALKRSLYKRKLKKMLRMLKKQQL